MCPLSGVLDVRLVLDLHLFFFIIKNYFFPAIEIKLIFSCVTVDLLNLRVFPGIEIDFFYSPDNNFIILKNIISLTSA